MEFKERSTMSLQAPNIVNFEKKILEFFFLELKKNYKSFFIEKKTKTFYW